MGTLIIRQPDGRYAEFSTIVDEFVGWDLDRHDLWSDLRYDAVRAAADELPSRLERTDERGTSSMMGAPAERDLAVAELIAVRDAQHGPDRLNANDADGRRDAYRAFLDRWRGWATGDPLPERPAEDPRETLTASTGGVVQVRGLPPGTVYDVESWPDGSVVLTPLP
jgi:hypothetical protein